MPKGKSKGRLMFYTLHWDFAAGVLGLALETTARAAYVYETYNGESHLQ